ncbi:MAG: hypothetical protein Q7K42_02025 [Candidatus Diapherotrites archaeon]|nr:hypothetical protein [Candidatus Diapherotrites archaeon]
MPGKNSLLEANLVRRTFTVRDMDFPPEVKLTKRSLLRWFALATGLISENESRDTVFDILDAVFFLCLKKKETPTTLELQACIKEKTGKKVSEKLLRYHANRLVEIGFVRKKNNRFMINNAPEGEALDLKSAYAFWVSQAISKTTANTEKVLGYLAEKYR